MRVVIVSQPKTGNVWIRTLLSQLYDLDCLNDMRDARVPRNGQEFAELIERGEFPDNSIFQEHLFPNPQRVLAPARRIGAHLVTMLRNPYDAFVSYYYYVNNFPEQFAGRPPSTLVGKEIDHPDVIAYIEGHYREHLKISLKWVLSGESIVLRYEDLKSEPVAKLTNLATQLQPVDASRIESVLEANRVDRLQANGGWLSKHVRSGSVGDWKNELSDSHLDAFRRCHAEVIKEIGYSVA